MELIAAAGHIGNPAIASNISVRKATISALRHWRGSAGVKFNAHGINRFALKRPFAAEIIQWCAAQSRRLRGRGIARLHLTVLQPRFPNLLDDFAG
jgi:hypothetical protein